MARIRILVVDDSVIIRELLCDALSKDPELEVIASAGDGRIALAKIAQLHPDLITLDVDMPVMPRDRFEKATTFGQYVERMKVNKENMQQFTNEVEVPASEVDWWKKQGKVNVVTRRTAGAIGVCQEPLPEIPEELKRIIEEKI